VPNLSESCFGLLAEAVEDAAEELFQMADRRADAFGLDVLYIEGWATLANGPATPDRDAQVTDVGRSGS
jgi:hypothetical protein